MRATVAAITSRPASVGYDEVVRHGQMNDMDLRARRAIERPHRQHERLVRTIVVAGVLAAIGGIAFLGGRPHSNQSVQAAVGGPAVDASPTTVAAAAAASDGSVPDLAIADDQLTEDCVVAPKSISVASSGLDVECLQQALVREGYYDGAVSGAFDGTTRLAVEKFQTDKDLYVDGVAGRVTNIELGIWPDEQLFVVHTPPPPPGAMDSMGYPLSSVSSTGSDAPPLPEKSGSGRRVVYERISQRVWAVDKNDNVIRSWLVTGSQYNNEVPGTYQVYSRSEQSTAWNGQAILPLMIRYYRTAIGAIGFHGIPIHVSDGTAYQTEAELGTRMSGGCQRQANRDAAFMWAFATEGTTVVVL